MSFDINPNRNLSNVQASAKSCPGGGGNTGYFRRDGDEEEAKIEFASDYPQDSFEKSGSEETTEQESFWSLLKGFFLDIIDAIKNFFVK